MKPPTVAPGELPYFPRPELLERVFKALGFRAGAGAGLRRVASGRRAGRSALRSGGQAGLTPDQQ